jgi:hypothetical protein
MGFDPKDVSWRKAQTDMRRLAQQYDVQAANTADPELAAELRAQAEAVRAAANGLKRKEP